MGPPGTGKTLLARALAGEAGVPFFSISASEFIEMFVGVGASRVRKLFEQAKARAPSIMFIDELDSVGRVRGTGLGGGHDEREQTLNQILAEMDGFEGHEAVIVLAATNRPDVLDPALLRPGRFDRHVVLDLPDRKARLAILRLHTKKVPVASEVNLDDMAAGTPGFSGADLKNLVNEAAMRAAREKRESVTLEDFEQMRDRVLIGTERSLVINRKKSIGSRCTRAGIPLSRVSCPRQTPCTRYPSYPAVALSGRHNSYPRKNATPCRKGICRTGLAVMLGGRVAERVLLGSVSSGADDDIQQATALARAMVTRWGMSADIGPVDLRESEEHPFLGREMAQPRQHSEASAESVDKAVRTLLKEAEGRAEALIVAHRAQVARLIEALEQHETLYQEDIAACLSQDPARQSKMSSDRTAVPLR